MSEPRYYEPTEVPHVEQVVDIHPEPFEGNEFRSIASQNGQSMARLNWPGVDMLRWDGGSALKSTSRHGNPIKDLHPYRSIEIPCLSPSERCHGIDNRSTTDNVYSGAHSQAQGMYHDVNPAYYDGWNVFGDPGDFDTEFLEAMTNTSYNVPQADSGAVGLAARISYLSVPLLDGMAYPTQPVPYQRASIPSVAYRNFGSPPFSSSPNESYYSARNPERPDYGLMPSTFNLSSNQVFGSDKEGKGWHGASESSPIFDPTLTTFDGRDLDDQPGTMQATESTFPALKESTTAFAPDEEQHPPEQRRRYRLPPRRRTLEPDEKEQVAIKRQLGLVCERHRRTKRKCNCRSPEELRCLQLSPP